MKVCAAIRYLCLLSAMILAVIIRNASAQTDAVAKPRYFGPKRVLLIPAARAGDTDKSLSLELEALIGESLRRLYSAPLYRPTVKNESAGALPDTRNVEATGRAASKPTPAEIIEALVQAGQKTDVDMVVLALVQEVTSRQMTLRFWIVDVKTAKASMEGQTMRRSLRDYPEAAQNVDGPSRSFSATFTLYAADAADHKRLLRQMLTEWGARQGR